MSAKLKMIPLCQLKRSRANTRKTDRLAGIEQLAASIAANGVLENLVVRPANSRKRSALSYDVIAGGRRHAALNLLVKRRKLERTHPVPCLLLGSAQNGTEASLAENFQRVPPHPADQFEAFAELARDGLSPDVIAARFGATETFVAQRLKLASISPRLVAEYRSGAMTLDQLTAFTLSADHALQEEVWFERGYADIPANAIRRMLTTSQVEGSDRRARFIGAKTYEAAGGAIVRDLFDSEDEGYFTDSQLLDRMVFEKLEDVAQAVRAEGWSWVEMHPDLDLVQLSQFGRAEMAERQLGEEEQAQISALSDRYDDLVSALEDGDDSLGAEIERIAEEMARIEASESSWPEEEKARAGAIVSLDPDGKPEVVRGLIRRDPSDAIGRREKSAPKKRTNGSGYPDSVMFDLSAHRMAAMRELMSEQPEVALTALLHALVGHLFYRGGGASCLRVMATAVSPEGVSAFVGTSTAGQAFAARHAAWRERLPESDALWDWIVQLSQEDRDSLLAHCVGMTVDVLHGAHGSRSGESQMERLATALSLDMRTWWRPTQANFLGRITKNDILTAVSEGVSQQASWRLASLKKDRMAKEAEKLLASSEWLPTSLRNCIPQEGAPD